MIIPPKYQLTSKITSLLASIEASRQVIDSVSIPPEVITNPHNGPLSSFDHHIL